MKRLIPLLALAVLIAGCKTPEHYIDVTTLQELPQEPYVYTLHPGDIVRVEIAEDENYDWKTTVLPDGTATFRWVEQIEVYGKSLRETRDILKDKLKPYYKDPTMTLYMERIGGPSPIVYLGNFGGAHTGNLGFQRSTGGTIPYRRGLGVIEAIALAGGPGESDVDVTPYLYVVRNIQSINERKVYRFDLAEAVRGGSPDLPLHPGDVIFLDQSWLQDLERALGITSRIVGTATQGLSTALFVDAISDGALTD
jgi:protein involved in polysaccharide export with SLBB domain